MATTCPHGDYQDNPVMLFVEVEPWERQRLSELCPRHCDMHFSEKRLEQLADREIPPGTRVLSGFVHSELSAGQLSRLDCLEFIATRSTGFDNIDIAECNRRGIRVANVPRYGDNTVAEHAFAMLLALTRKIHRCYERTSRGDFSLEGLRGVDLAGKTFGCLGVGNIGEKAMRIAGGFGMNRIAFDVRPDPLASGAGGFRYVDLDTLLAESDVLSLHVPLNDHTRHIINAQTLAKMKPTAILLNTSRGAVVDTAALLEALRSGRLGGAGLDVLEKEELVSEEAMMLHQRYDLDTLRQIVQSNALLRMENVIITPHNAFNSQEATQRIVETTLDNIHAWLAGEPINIVNH